MHVEPYNPELHEAYLQAWYEQWGFSFDTGMLSGEGYVACDDEGPLAAVWVYRDPSCKVVFIDNVIAGRTGRAKNAFAMMGAFRRLWQAVAAACRHAFVIVQTASPFVIATLKRDKWTAAPQLATYRATYPFFLKGA